MSEIRKWLEAIGLGQYGDAFQVNKVDMDLLGQVDDQILKDIGVTQDEARREAAKWFWQQ